METEGLSRHRYLAMLRIHIWRQGYVGMAKHGSIGEFDTAMEDWTVHKAHKRTTLLE